MPLPLGTPAPDFTLANQFGQPVGLGDFRGVKPVALAFFPLAFSETCQGELCELRDNLGMFDDAGVELIGVSVDSKYSLRAWADQQNYDFALLADFWPHGEVARAYDAFLDGRGTATRATYVIDTQGRIVEAFATEPGRARPLTAYRKALAALG